MKGLRTTACIVAGAVVFALIVNAHGLLEAHRQKAAAQSAFADYANAMVAHDYARAFAGCSESFKKALPLELFVAQQRDIETELGALKAVVPGGTYVHGTGSPMKWVALIDTKQDYEKGETHFVCELHNEDRQWKVFGCKRV